MSIRTMRKFGAAIAAAVMVMTVTAAQAGSDSHTTLEPVGVVAGGLDNPRHLAVNQLGRLYVAEAGRGGTTLVDTPLGDSDGPICVGLTGSISRIAQGEARTVIGNLPSVAEAVDGQCEGPGIGFGATGPHGLDVNRSNPTYSIGLGGTPPVRDLLVAAVPEASHLGTVNNPHWRRYPTTDLADFEFFVDPNGDGPDSNPYGLERMSGSMTLATDAGGNKLVRLGRDGSVQVVALFAPNCVAWGLPFPNPIPAAFNPCGDQAFFPADAVPTAVTEAPNGDFLVTTLGGFPFVPGQSRVFRVQGDFDGTASCSTFAPVPAAGCEVFADDLTALVDIAIAPDDKVYVVQFADDGILAGTGTGSVQILHHRTGAKMGSIVGLTSPGGIAIDHRKVYISNYSIAPGFGEIVEARTLCTQHKKSTCQNG